MIVYMIFNTVSYLGKFFLMFLFFMYIWYYGGFEPNVDDDENLKSFIQHQIDEQDQEQGKVKQEVSERRGTKHQLANLTADI